MRCLASLLYFAIVALCIFGADNAFALATPASGLGNAVRAEADPIVDTNTLIMPFDADGDGTTWQVCECGTATSPADDAQWLCGVGYTAGDSPDNPAECEYDGQRIWDDIGDDYVAAEHMTRAGTTVIFAEGTYVIKGTDATDNTLCWDSGEQAYTQTCPRDENIAVANVMARHSGMTLKGQGVDASGLKDFKYEGTHFVKNKGNRVDWRAAGNSGDTVLDNGQVCVGYPRSGAHGQCGPSATDGIGGTTILLPIRKGACYDGDDNGTCDYEPLASAGANVFDLGDTAALNLQDPNVLCLDDTSNWVTDNMSVGSLHYLSQQGRGSGIGRVLYRVESIRSTPSNADCAAISGAVEAVLGGTDLLADLSGESYPTAVFTEIFGTEGTGGSDEPNGTISAAVNPAKLTHGITVTGMWFSHKDFRGNNGCSIAGTESACDEGTLITIGGGFNHKLDGIGIIQSNTAWGSGGAINYEPYATMAVVENSIFRHSTGAGLIDLGNSAIFRNNYVADNMALDLDNHLGAVQDGAFLIRNQGVFYRIEDNLFERNFLGGDQWEGGIVDVIGDYGTVKGNRFLSTPSTCLHVGRGLRHLDVRDNTFDCGDYAGPSPSGGSTGYSITIRAGDQSEFIRVQNNRFLGGGRNTNESDTGAINVQFHVLVKASGGNTTRGDIGRGGFHFVDNFVQTARFSTVDSAIGVGLLGIRGPEDPDNERIFLDGNWVTQGGLLIEATLPAAGSFGGYMDDNDDGVGLPRCGRNFVDGVAYGDFNRPNTPGSLTDTNPDQCSGL